MFNYMKNPCNDRLVTIQEACALLGLTKDELRSKCEQYGVLLYNWDGQWGFPSYHFRCFNNTLYYEQCRDGCDDSLIFTDTLANQSKPPKTSQPQSSALSYIENIKGLEPTYALTEVCTLLGITSGELEKICDENDFLTIQKHDGTWSVTCYEYLTLNNMLYRERCEASGEGNRCV